jgi:hypothetical protein
MATVVPDGAAAASATAAATRATVSAAAAHATGQGHLIGSLYGRERGVGIRVSTELQSRAGGEDSGPRRP